MTLRRFSLVAAVAAAAIIALLLWPQTSTTAAPPKPISRHVLIIGVDGAMPAAVLKAKAPNLKSLAAGGTVSWNAFAGGVKGTATQQNTASMASWHTILTGVWGNKHRGTRMRRGRPLPADHKNYPTIFQRVKKVDPKARCASIVNWPRINHVMVPGTDLKAKGENDEKTADLAVAEIATNGPTVLFVQLDEVDGAGHGNNYGPDIPPYVKAIEAVDKQVGRMVAAVRKRQKRHNEQWLIIAVTDHGGTTDGKGGGRHGGQSDAERRVFLIVNGPGVPKQVVKKGPGIVAVTPTALTFLGIQIKPEWKLDGQPFGLSK